MPTSAAEQREDEVISLLVVDLMRLGFTAAVLDRPDRNPDRTDGLTVDAELAVGHEVWAVDITTLRWRSELEGAIKKLTARLEREFGAQLQDAGMTLVLTCHVSSDETVIRSLLDFARTCVISGTAEIRGDEAVQLWPWSEDLGAIRVQPWLGQSADLAEEIHLSSGDVLGKKLQRQLARARTLGYRTCLAIDRRGAADLEYGGNFLPAPETILAAVEREEADVGETFDVVALVSSDDVVRWLRQ